MTCSSMHATWVTCFWTEQKLSNKAWFLRGNSERKEEKKTQVKVWKKSKEDGSSRDYTINHGMTKFIHPFLVNYHLFLIMVMGRWSLSLGRGRNTALTVCQSCTHKVIYYNIGLQIITLPRISYIFGFNLKFSGYHNRDNLENITNWRYWMCFLLLLLISR